MNAKFRKIIEDVDPIELKDPLAEVLGAFENKGSIQYSFKEVVKLAGHPCPTISSSYIACKKALERLYGKEVPIRGEISIDISGEPDEGVYGVISQVFSFITGAAPSTGFKGLGTLYNRKDLLKFGKSSQDDTMIFIFGRSDNGKKVRVSLLSHNLPYNKKESSRMNDLFQKVLWDAAKEGERREFQDLWMKKVERILNEEDINNWLVMQDE